MTCTLFIRRYRGIAIRVFLLGTLALPVLAQTTNPNQIALLRWYGANTTTSFNAGSGPYRMAFDGANIWCRISG
jgi:hypothetical protein